MKFYTSIRMDVRKIETLKKNNEVYGARIRVKIVKNKVAPPFKEAQMTITAAGIDHNDSLIDSAIAVGVISKSGAFLRYSEKMLGQGKEQAKEVLEKDDKLKAHIIKDVMEKSIGKKE